MLGPNGGAAGQASPQSACPWCTARCCAVFMLKAPAARKKSFAHDRLLLSLADEDGLRQRQGSLATWEHKPRQAPAAEGPVLHSRPTGAFCAC